MPRRWWGCGFAMPNIGSREASKQLLNRARLNSFAMRFGSAYLEQSARFDDIAIIVRESCRTHVLCYAHIQIQSTKTAHIPLHELLLVWWRLVTIKSASYVLCVGVCVCSAFALTQLCALYGLIYRTKRVMRAMRVQLDAACGFNYNQYYVVGSITRIIILSFLCLITRSQAMWN